MGMRIMMGMTEALVVTVNGHSIDGNGGSSGKALGDYRGT
jgi:hypothetical protein